MNAPELLQDLEILKDSLQKFVYTPHSASLIPRPESTRIASLCCLLVSKCARYRRRLSSSWVWCSVLMSETKSLISASMKYYLLFSKRRLYTQRVSTGDLLLKASSTMTQLLSSSASKVMEVHLTSAPWTVERPTYSSSKSESWQV